MAKLNKEDWKKEQRQKQADMMVAAVEKMCTDEGFANFLSARKRMHRYSVNNWLMIWSQCPEATFVQGYGNKAGTSGWKAVGRQVRKGETSIKIFAPMTGKVRNEDGTETTKVFGFKLVPVFDLSQTEGEPFGIPDGGEVAFEGDAHMLLDQLTGVASDKGYTVERRGAGSPSGAKGAMNPETGEIWLDATLPIAEQVAVLVHELCHAFDPELSLDAYRVHRGDFEIVAEAAAFMVLDALGFDAVAPSAAYVAGWAGGEPSKVVDLLKRTRRRWPTWFRRRKIKKSAGWSCKVQTHPVD